MWEGSQRAVEKPQEIKPGRKEEKYAIKKCHIF
jgi:hypothetical protein